MEKSLLVSLVIATLGRTEELGLFFESLLSSEEKNFEVIVVDQNEDDRLRPILDKYASHFPLKTIKLQAKNASLARNVGAAQAQGYWLTFPDDDCLYNAKTLSLLKKLTAPKDPEMVLCALYDLEGQPLNQFRKKHSRITFLNFTGKVHEPAMFMHRKVFEAVSGYDINFGPGSESYAAEAYELVTRCLKKNIHIVFDADAVVLHPRKIPPYDAASMVIGYRYSYGFGCLLAKHFGIWPTYYLTTYIVRFIAKMLLFKGARKEFEIQRFKGMWRGFRDRRRSNAHQI